jgi:hypothetical protein
MISPELARIHGYVRPPRGQFGAEIGAESTQKRHHTVEG